MPTGVPALCPSGDEEGRDLGRRSLSALSNVALLNAWLYGRRERKAVALRLFTDGGVTARDLLAARSLEGTIEARGRPALVFSEDNSLAHTGTLLHFNGFRQRRGGIQAGMEFVGQPLKVRDVRDLPNPDPRPTAFPPAFRTVAGTASGLRTDPTNGSGPDGFRKIVMLPRLPDPPTPVECALARSARSLQPVVGPRPVHGVAGRHPGPRSGRLEAACGRLAMNPPGHALAFALSPQHGETGNALQGVRSLAGIPGGSDGDSAARAWFSSAYPLGLRNLRKSGGTATTAVPRERKHALDRNRHAEGRDEIDARRRGAHTIHGRRD